MMLETAVHCPSWFTAIGYFYASGKPPDRLQPPMAYWQIASPGSNLRDAPASSRETATNVEAWIALNRMSRRIVQFIVVCGHKP
jgi:hypothetical protein